MTDKEIIIHGVNVAECEFYELCGCIDDNHELNECKDNPNCYYKQLKRLEFENKLLKADYEASEQENKKLKYYLNKIRDDELYSMDVEWDEYITECTSTEYTNIITFVEKALGERDE